MSLRRHTIAFLCRINQLIAWYGMGDLFLRSDNDSKNKSDQNLLSEAIRDLKHSLWCTLVVNVFKQARERRAPHG